MPFRAVQLKLYCNLVKNFLLKKVSFILFLIALIPFGGINAGAQTINTYAGNGVAGFGGDGGAATTALINLPYAVAADGSGNVYIADHDNHRIRKVDPSGIITTIAGTGTGSYFGDGGAATLARIQKPRAVAIDPAGNVVFSDYGNNRIRKINVTTGIITTIAGTGGIPAFSGDGGPATAAQLGYAWGIAYDAAGNLYIADNQNCRIRKVTPAGIISTIAGNGSCFISGDGGPAIAARVQYPTGVAVDGTGNIYIADNGNNRVRKINTSGTISTIAGSPTYGFSGDGGPGTAAMVSSPVGIATDPSGNVYIADQNNNRIRKINTAGIISTYAGNGTPGYAGDGGMPALAALNHPSGFATDGLGKFYIADNENNRIRIVQILSHAPMFTGGRSQSRTICPVEFIRVDSLLAVYDVDTGQTENWSVVTPPAHGVLVAAYTALSTGATIYPTGLTYAPASGYLGLDSFKVQVSDGLFADTTTIYITIVAPPDPGTVTGRDSVCIGDSVMLTNAVTGGVWSSDNILVSSVSGAGWVTGVGLGTNTISYTVTNACDSRSATKIITVQPLPNAGVISGADSICRGDSLLFTTTGTGGTWRSSNTALATVSAGGMVKGVWGGSVIITYSVTNYCGTSVATRNLKVRASCSTGAAVKNTTGMATPSLFVFPNPNSGIATITLQTPINEVATIVVINKIGEKVKELKVVTNTPTELRTDLPNGLYFITATTSAGTAAEKIIINK